ncbi:hypothetical protein EMCRGX_G019576 [Ephydatia muelleri]
MSESVFSQFDNDVLHCFELSSAIELTLPAAKQASLNLCHGGLGLRSLHRHTSAANISSLTTSMPSDNCSVTSKVYLLATVNAYNAMVSQPDAISVESVLDVPPHQHALSSHIEEADFNSLFSDATTMTKARLQAFSAPQGHAWLKVQLSPKLGLALMPDEAQSTTNVVVVQPAAVTTTTVVHKVGDHFYTLSIVMTILCCVCGGWWALLCTLPAITLASAAKTDDANGNTAAATQKGHIALGLNIAAIVLYFVVFIIIVAASAASNTVSATSSSSYSYSYSYRYYCKICYSSYCTYSYSYSPSYSSSTYYCY